MPPNTLVILAGTLAAGFAIVAALFYSQAAKAKAAAATSSAERDSVMEDLAAIKKKVQRRDKEQAKRTEEMSDLRRKLDKLKKRTKQHLHEADEVPEQITRLERELAAEKLGADNAREQLHQARVGVATLQKELEGFRSGDKTDQLAAHTAELESKIKELEGCAKKAEARAAKATEEAATAKKSAAKHKAKNEVLDKTYVVLRGEHELKKDEARNLRAEVERLLALRVGITEDPIAAKVASEVPVEEEASPAESDSVPTETDSEEQPA